MVDNINDYLDTSNISEEDLPKAMYEHSCNKYRTLLKGKYFSLRDDIMQMSWVREQFLFNVVWDLDKNTLLNLLDRIIQLTKRIQLTASIMRGLAYHIPNPPEGVDDGKSERWTSFINYDGDSKIYISD